MSDSFKVYASKDYVENKIEESRVQPDWNQNDETAPDYIKGRPFYTGDVVDTELLPETTISSWNDGDPYWTEMETSATFEEGQVYTVKWNEVEYTLTASVFDGMLYIGNLSIFDAGDDNGVPFLMLLFSGAGLEIDTNDVASASDSRTFSIHADIPEVVKIPEKYLNTPYVSYDFAQNLSSARRETARNNICAVSYEEQDLDDVHKFKARQNIGAGTSHTASQVNQTIDSTTQSHANLTTFCLFKFVGNNIIAPCSDGDAFVGGYSLGTGDSKICNFHTLQLTFIGDQPSYGYNRVVATGSGTNCRLATDSDVAWTTVLVTEQSITGKWCCQLPIYEIPTLK